ncbi:hypothetical protein [Burkholderia gladioli]|uniref:hypothetical protein n=1 Tax=Burkholderia gladioli TaxID=28095 RepID=UPI000BBD0C11|nr:hypothetical protein [Burkholderia gladioli]ATF90085.1 hypothetical protein CO712_35135 [Burkholderia gladioli pv. gladioli]MBJ9662298.1 hypothetical protein [Burkholderia gladioli]MBU9193153.1 hypothetical protein [Burkholderia gladioli]MDN7804064.1 hypothetical protein [Burkholderia gladioli]
MKFDRKMVQWMAAALAGACLQVTGANAQALNLPLGTPDGFSASSIRDVGQGRYCISGRVYDDAGPSNTAMAVLVDARHRTVLWKTSIPHPRDYVGNSAVACAASGDAYYVVTQQDTQASEAQKQTRVVVSRISSAGRIEQQQTIEAGFDEWFYGLDVSAAGVAVAGGTSATAQRNGPFGTFVARFDPNLGAPKLGKLDSGAFWVGSSARIDAQHLLVAGQFMPNAGAGRDAIAASRIDLGSGKYQWSAYPLPDNTRSARAWLSPEGGVAVVGLTPTEIAVATLDRNGKPGVSFAGKKTLCTIEAVSMAGSTLQAIGRACDGAGNTSLVSIDLNARTLGAPRSLGGKLEAAGFDGGGWVGVSQGHGAALQRGGE